MECWNARSRKYFVVLVYLVCIISSGLLVACVFLPWWLIHLDTKSLRGRLANTTLELGPIIGCYTSDGGSRTCDSACVLHPVSSIYDCQTEQAFALLNVINIVLGHLLFLNRASFSRIYTKCVWPTAAQDMFFLITVWMEKGFWAMLWYMFIRPRTMWPKLLKILAVFFLVVWLILPTYLTFGLWIKANNSLGGKLSFGFALFVANIAVFLVGILILVIVGLLTMYLHISSGSVEDLVYADREPPAMLQQLRPFFKWQRRAKSSTSSTAASLGVDIAVLQYILTQAELLGDLTTDMVCEQFIKPATRSQSCSYLDLLLVDQPLDSAIGRLSHRRRQLHGPANIFVSHAWKYPFKLVVSALAEIAAREPETYFWIDLVVNNQHKAKDLKFEWWCTTFKSSIKKIGRVALVLSPWNDPIPLKRAWCLWEIYSAADSRVDFRVVLPPAEENSFQTAIKRDYAAIMEALLSVHVEKSECFNAEDRQNIFSAVQESCGMQHLNKAVSDRLRRWCVQTATDMVDGIDAAAQADLETTRFCFNVAKAMVAFGDKQGAGQVMERVQQALRQLHSRTEDVLSLMAAVQEMSGDYAAALGLYQELLRDQAQRIGDEEAKTSLVLADTLQHLGRLYTLCDNFDEALRSYTALLDIRRAAVIVDRAATSVAYNCLADTMSKLNRFEKAIENYQSALKVLTDETADFEQMAKIYSEMAEVYDRNNALGKALDCQLKCFHLRTTYLGLSHPDTATTHGAIAWIYMRTQDYHSAFEHLKAKFLVDVIIYGEKHDTVRKDCAYLMLAHGFLGDYCKSLEYLFRAVF